MRAGIIAGDKQDIHILSVMKTLNVVNDNFGSEKDTRRLIHPFSHFLHAVTTDYKDDWNPLVDGLALLDKVFPNPTEVNAYGLRAFALLTELLIFSNNHIFFAEIIILRNHPTRSRKLRMTTSNLG